MASLVNSTKEDIILILHKVFQKITKERTLTNLFYEDTITLIAKLAKTLQERKTISLITYTAKILNKMLANQINIFKG